MKELKFIVACSALLVVILNSCGSQDFIEKNRIVGDYYLIAIDTRDDMHLSYQVKEGGYVGIVPETVIAVGNDSSFIVVIQRPMGSRATVNYYIVPIYNEYTVTPEEGILGPLSLTQFEERKKELNIAHKIKFMDI